MPNNLNRLLIENTVRKTINQIKNDPERGIRNVVDLALTFSNGRFQKHFLSLAQKMLSDEHSSYYRMIPEQLANIDTERLIAFGMNVGYNSCTYGAEKIRSIEKKEHFNIPWTIALSLSGADYLERKASYRSLIEQGTELGIFTWNIFSLGNLYTLLEIVEAFPDCAFTIFCNPTEISRAILDEAANLNNVMFVIKYSEQTERACSLLRSGKFLYSVYVSYDEENVDSILCGDLLADTEQFSPSFTIFTASSRCSLLSTQDTVYEYIKTTRLQQSHRTIPFDMLHDVQYIDSIISNEAVTVSLNREGVLHPLSAAQSQEVPNSVFNYPLTDLLKQLSQIR